MLSPLRFWVTKEQSQRGSSSHSRSHFISCTELHTTQHGHWILLQPPPLHYQVNVRTGKTGPSFLTYTLSTQRGKCMRNKGNLTISGQTLFLRGWLILLQDCKHEEQYLTNAASLRNTHLNLKQPKNILESAIYSLTLKARITHTHISCSFKNTQL